MVLRLGSVTNQLYQLYKNWKIEVGTSTTLSNQSFVLRNGNRKHEAGTWNIELGTWNLELGTWNFEF